MSVKGQSSHLNGHLLEGQADEKHDESSPQEVRRDSANEESEQDVGEWVAFKYQDACVYCYSSLLWSVPSTTDHTVTTSTASRLTGL